MNAVKKFFRRWLCAFGFHEWEAVSGETFLKCEHCQTIWEGD